ncbi:MAG: hypothetical protein PVG08_18145, partial [Desulfobacterales bacterium]
GGRRIIRDPVHAWTLYAREPGDLRSTRGEVGSVDRSGKACGLNLDMYAAEKSDINIVPKKVPNNVGRPTAEAVEGRTSATCTQRQEEALNGLDRIREAARRDKTLRFTSLMHHITSVSVKGSARRVVSIVRWTPYRWG